MIRRCPSGRAALLLCLSLALPGCWHDEEPAPAAPEPPPGSTEANTPESVPELRDGEPLGVFAGTLPCDDCAGIRTVLTLHLEPDRFVLEETRLGTREGDRSVRSEGAWSMLEASTDLPDAMVIRIDPGTPEGVRSFLALGAEKLELLDAEGRRVASESNRTLVRQPRAGS